MLCSQQILCLVSVSQGRFAEEIQKGPNSVLARTQTTVKPSDTAMIVNI